MAATIQASCPCGAELSQTEGRGRPRKWCSETCRRNFSYGGECIDCGEATRYSGHDGTGPSLRCPRCAMAARIVWGQERVVEKIREWADQFGEPPLAYEWHLAGARHKCSPERLGEIEGRLDRFDGDVPSTSLVVLRFGSWNAAIEAAGFTSLKVGGKRHLREVPA